MDSFDEFIDSYTIIIIKNTAVRIARAPHLLLDDEALALVRHDLVVDVALPRHLERP
jgi:hypothetical protein